jgi:predicted RecB family nuclease
MRRFALTRPNASEPSGSRRRGRRWVSKTDLTTYVRCPYAFWLLHRGVITRDQLVDELQARLLTEGAEFQDHVEAELPTVAGDLLALLSRDAPLLGTPLFENRRLMIYGRPDGVEPAGGALLPVEIKSHKDVEPSDKLELAFYWLLLEPLRKRSVAEPRGVLLLRRDGEPERVEVALSPYHFERVRDLLGEIRQARAEGVRPRVCGCNVCSRAVKEHVLRDATRNDDLTLLWDVGAHRARLLERLGVSTCKQLLCGDAAELAERLRARKHYVSIAQVERWQHHARAYAMRGPVFFGDSWPIGPRFIALDLEYFQGPDGLIWLIGGSVVDGQESTPFSFWADTLEQERLALRGLSVILDQHRDAPLVTWAGTGADIPNLRHASSRAGLKKLRAVSERHVDLFQYATKSFRLPFPNLGLKEVAEYFGIPRVSAISSGLEALGRYEEYRRTRSAGKGRQLRAELEDYNRDDVVCLVAIAERLRALAASLPTSRSSRARRCATLDSRPSRRRPGAPLVGQCGGCQAPVRRGEVRCGCGWLLLNDPFDVLARDDVLPRQRLAIELELRAVAQTGPKTSGQSADAYSQRFEDSLCALVLPHVACADVEPIDLLPAADD